MQASYELVRLNMWPLLIHTVFKSRCSVINKNFKLFALLCLTHVVTLVELDGNLRNTDDNSREVRLMLNSSFTFGIWSPKGSGQS